MLNKWRNIVLLLSMFLTVAYSSGTHAQTPNFDLHEKSFRCHFAEDAKKNLKDFTSDEIKLLTQEALEEVRLVLDSAELSRSEKKILREHYKLLKSISRISDPKLEITNFYTDFCLSTESVFKGAVKGVGHTTNVINLTLTFPARFLRRFVVGLKSGVENTTAPMTLHDILGNQRVTSIGYFFLYRSYSAALGSYPLTAPLFAVPLMNALIMRVCTESSQLNEKDHNFCENFLKTKVAFFNAANLGQKWGASLRNKPPRDPSKTWSEEIRDDNFCEYLLSVNSNKTPKFRAEEFREALVSSFNPGLMAKPDSKIILTNDDLLLRGNVTRMAGLRNIIISLAPPEDSVRLMKSSGSWDKYNKIQKDLSKLRKVFNKLYRLKDLNKCRELKAKKDFKYESYLELKSKLESFKEESLFEQNLIVENQVNQLTSKFNLFQKTNLNWELIPSNSLNKVKDLLREPNVGNLIIITHSVGDYKKMIDSTFNQYPSTYFGSISPSLMSLSFYTCHSQNILETYGLVNVLAGTPSFHQKKVINFVQENDILDDGEQVPLSGFSDFLKKVDHSLSLTLQENLLSHAFLRNNNPTKPDKVCKIEIPTNIPLSGSLSVILNREFIGNINRFEKKNEFVFDCSVLKNNNTLLLQNSALFEKLQVVSLPDDLILNGEKVLNAEWRNFFDQNGSYSSSKIRF